MKTVYVVVLVLYAVCMCTAAYVSGQKRVTPPAPSTSASELADGKCYNRSSVSEGPYFKHCKRSRGNKGGIGDWVYFRSRFVNESDTQNLADVDEVMDSYSLVFNILESDKSDQAKKCLDLGSKFLCAAFYPFCNPARNGDKDTEFPPCKGFCDNAKMYCEEILKTKGIAWDDRFDCENFKFFPVGGQCVPGPEIEEEQPVAPSPSVILAVESTSHVQQPITSTRLLPLPTSTPTTPTTAPDFCGSLPVYDLPECKNCKKVRNAYSKALLSSKGYSFVARVRVLNIASCNLRGLCYYCYNVTIEKNFNVTCDSSVDKFGCKNTALVYSDDPVMANSCTCVKHHIEVGKEYVIAGIIRDGEWLITGKESGGSIVSEIASKTIKKAKKIEGWYKNKIKCPGRLTRTVCGK